MVQWFSIWSTWDSGPEWAFPFVNRFTFGELRAITAFCSDVKFWSKSSSRIRRNPPSTSSSPSSEMREPKTRAAQHSAILFKTSCWTTTMSLTHWSSQSFHGSCTNNQNTANSSDETIPSREKLIDVRNAMTVSMRRSFGGESLNRLRWQSLSLASETVSVVKQEVTTRATETLFSGIQSPRNASFRFEMRLSRWPSRPLESHKSLNTVCLCHEITEYGQTMSLESNSGSVLCEHFPNLHDFRRDNGMMVITSWTEGNFIFIYFLSILSPLNVIDAILSIFWSSPFSPPMNSLLPFFWHLPYVLANWSCGDLSYHSRTLSIFQIHTSLWNLLFTLAEAGWIVPTRSQENIFQLLPNSSFIPRGDFHPRWKVEHASVDL